MSGVKDLSLLDKELARYAEIFTQILLYRCRDTLLPELIEVFGRDRLPKFLDIFAGTTFQVPSREIITHAARDADIYECLSRGMPHSVMQDKHGVSRDTVDSAFRRVKKIIEGSSE
jgi:hypothetical protein